MTSAVDAGIKWRPKPSEVAELGPEFQEYWDSYFANAPDKPVLWMGISSACVLGQLDCQDTHYHRRPGSSGILPWSRRANTIPWVFTPWAHLSPPPHNHTRNAPNTRTRRNTPSRADAYTSPTRRTSMRPQTLSPASSSRLYLFLAALTSGPHTNNFLFTRKADVRPMTWGYKFLREIARRMPHFRGEPPVLHPAFTPGGPASVVAHAEGPVPFDAPRIVYSEEDERALEVFARTQGMWFLPFSVSHTSALLAHPSFIHSFSCPGRVVATCWHSVSSLLYKARSVRY